MKKLIALFLICSPGAALAQAPAAAPAPLRPAPPELALPGDAALIQNCTGLLSMEKTYALARHWIDAWNSNSTDRVMALYAPDFEFRAVGILTNARIANPSGILHGQADNRLRWFGAAKEKSSQQFRLIDAYTGVASIAIHYVNRGNVMVVETEEYGPDCKVVRSNAMYGIGPAIPAPPQ